MTVRGTVVLGDPGFVGVLRLRSSMRLTNFAQNDTLIWGARMEEMKHTIALLLAVVSLGLAGCRSTPPPTPLSELNPQQTRGHAVFQARCAMCHYDRQSGPLHGPSLLGLFKKPALPSGAAPTDERVSATITHGRNMMPAMGNQLDDTDVNDVIAYLRTL